MHRHGYKGRKFARTRDQRRAFLKGLASSLIEHGKIETTLPRAKEIVPYVEKLITKAKVGDLHNRRQVIAKLSTITIAHKLVDEIAPVLTGRNSGHLRVLRTRLRVGDNAQLASVSFVDELTPQATDVIVPALVDAAVEAKVKPAAKPKVKAKAVAEKVEE